MQKIDIQEATSADEVLFETFINGSSKRNAEQVKKWIGERRLKRSQLVSLTMNETSIGDKADNIMTLFYRKKARIP